jgi:integrase
LAKVRFGPNRLHFMRHTDIRTTMNVYGDVVTKEMAEASSKVAGLAFTPQSA